MYMSHGSILKPGVLICLLGGLYYRLKFILYASKEVLTANRRVCIIDAGSFLDRRLLSSVFPRSEEQLLHRLIILRPRAYTETVAAIYLCKRRLSSGDLMACIGVSKTYQQLIAQNLSDRLLPLRFLSAVCAPLWDAAHRQNLIAMIEVESVRLEGGGLKPIGGDVIPYWADVIAEVAADNVVKVIKSPA